MLPEKVACGVDMNNKSVLVVDDDKLICEIVREVLEEEGFQVRAAVGESAVQLARSEPPDLILLDLRMPVLDGRAIRERLLGDPRTATVPCVLMSSELQLKQLARELQLQACLPKPFEITDLVDVVRRQTHVA